MSHLSTPEPNRVTQDHLTTQTAWRATGQAYPSGASPTQTIQEFRSRNTPEASGVSVLLTGRIRSLRRHGQVTFRLYWIRSDLP